MLNLLKIWTVPKNPCNKCVVKPCCTEMCELKYNYRDAIYPFDIHDRIGLMEFYFFRWIMIFCIVGMGVSIIKMIECFLNVEV